MAAHDIIEGAINEKIDDFFDQGNFAAADEIVFDIIKNVLQLKQVPAQCSYLKIMEDYCLWPDKNSIRKGYLVYEMKTSDESYNNNNSSRELFKKMAAVNRGDYRVIVISPFKPGPDIDYAEEIKNTDTTAIINLSNELELSHLSNRLAVINLMEESNNYNQKLLEKKREQTEEDLHQRLFLTFQQADIIAAGKKCTIKETINSSMEDIEDVKALMEKIKTRVFNDTFSRYYDQYPEFTETISPDNITKKTEDAVRFLIAEEDNLSGNYSWQLLADLNLIDSQGYPDSTCRYCELIINEFHETDKEELKIQEVLKILGRPPTGLQYEFTCMVLTVLTLNGDIKLILEKGLEVSGSEFKKFMGVELDKLFTSLLNKFSRIKAVCPTDDISFEEIAPLLQIMNLEPDLLKEKKARPHLVRQFKDMVAGIEEKIKEIDDRLQQIKQKNRRNLNRIVLQPLLQKRDGLSSIPLEQFCRVQRAPDLKRLVFGKRELEKIEIGFRFLRNLSSFLEEFTKDIIDDYFYLQNSWKIINQNQVYFNKDDIGGLKEIVKKCEKLMEEAVSFLDEPKLSLLMEKLSVYHEHYRKIYYNSHQRTAVKGQDSRLLQEGRNILKLRAVDKFEAVSGMKISDIEKLEQLLVKMEEISCNLLDKFQLKDDYICPHCKFPEYSQKFGDMPEGRIISEYMLEEMEKIVNSITDNIIREINNLKCRLDDVAPEEREIIDNILQRESLPEEIDNRIISAFNQIFSPLEVVEITSQELVQAVFANTDVVTFASLKERTAEMSEKLLADIEVERENIRIKITGR